MPKHWVLLALFPLTFAPGVTFAVEKPLEKIAFGSCAHQDKPAPIWKTIDDSHPDLLALLGDNVYADTEDPAVLKASYAKLAENPGFKALRASTSMVAIWDDHDFGENDGGVEFPAKDMAQKVLLDFFKEPADSPRRTRKGVYESYLYGPPGKRIQLILLDTRYWRSPLKKKFWVWPIPDPDPAKTMLGAEQWKWLEKQLEVPADLRLIGTGVQVIPEEQKYEKWANFPLERKKLLDLLAAKGATRTIILSGDRHFGEISCVKASWGEDLCEITSSGLNRGGSAPSDEKNKYRRALYDGGNHFGMLQLTWGEAGKVDVDMQLRDESGAIRASLKLGFPGHP